MSPRLLADTTTGHVDSFETYVDDMETVLAAIRTSLDTAGAGPETNLFLSNSMGGAIGIGHLQRQGADTPIRAASFLGLMIHVSYLSFTELAPTWQALRMYPESGALLQSR